MNDFLQGDSGGSLYTYDHMTQSYKVIGIVAAGIGCGSREFPGLFTEVAYYHHWIQNIVGSN